MKEPPRIQLSWETDNKTTIKDVVVHNIIRFMPWFKWSTHLIPCLTAPLPVCLSVWPQSVHVQLKVKLNLIVVVACASKCNPHPPPQAQSICRLLWTPLPLSVYQCSSVHDCYCQSLLSMQCTGCLYSYTECTCFIVFWTIYPRGQ